MHTIVRQLSCGFTMGLNGRMGFLILPLEYHALQMKILGFAVQQFVKDYSVTNGALDSTTVSAKIHHEPHLAPHSVCVCLRY